MTAVRGATLRVPSLPGEVVSQKRNNDPQRHTLDKCPADPPGGERNLILDHGCPAGKQQRALGGDVLE
jgi:hypothetical protein